MSNTLAIHAALIGLSYESAWLKSIQSTHSFQSKFRDSGQQPRNYHSRSKYKPRIDTPKCERKK